MSITLIAAISENNIIGNDNKLPWHIPEDLKRFKKLTNGHPIIIGRKTYFSIPEKNRPLSERKNIVLSKSLEEQEGIYLARNVNDAIKLIGDQDSFVIGGARVFEIFLPIADKMEITRVHKEYLGDIYFPKIKWSDWKLINEDKGISKNEQIPYSFLNYIRIR